MHLERVPSQRFVSTVKDIHGLMKKILLTEFTLSVCGTNCQRRVGFQYTPFHQQKMWRPIEDTKKATKYTVGGILLFICLYNINLLTPSLLANRPVAV
jgi:hypothetical protein